MSRCCNGNNNCGCCNNGCRRTNPGWNNCGFGGGCGGGGTMWPIWILLLFGFGFGFGGFW